MLVVIILPIPKQVMRWAFVITIILGVLPLGGQEGSKAVDYGAGLEQLARLGGLPEMRGAKWITVRNQGGDDDSYDSVYQSRQALKGNGWEVAGQAGVLGFGEMTTSGAESAKGGEKAKGESVAKTDAAALSASLRDPKMVERYQNEFERGNAESMGKPLLFAVQLHAAGETEAANDLAAALFALTPDKSQVVDAAISQIASAEFKRASDKFFNDYNWQGYLDELKRLQVKFPRGWADGPAVAMLIAGVEKRAAGAAVKKPELPDIELKPAALDALERLLAAPKSNETSDEEISRQFGVNLADLPASQRDRYRAIFRQRLGDGMDSNGLWLLDEPSKEPSSPVEELKAMGMDGLIALAAVATDETLVPLAHFDRSGGYMGYSRGSDEDAAQARYMALKRPRGRGEVAMGLLNMAVPGERDEPDAEQLRDEAIEFWQKHRKSGLVEVAELYLTEGNSQQRRLATSYLCASDDPTAGAAFEKAVLGGEAPHTYMSEVDTYLSKRGPAAVGFYKEYAKAVREYVVGLRSGDDTYEMRQAEGIEKLLGSMGIKVGTVSLAELIEAALKPGDEPAAEEEFSGDFYPGGPTGGSKIRSLGMAISSLPMADCLKAFAGAASKATPAQLAEIHDLLQERGMRGAREGQADTAAGESLPSEVVELWRPMLADKNPLPKEHTGIFATFGDSAAFILELAAFPDTQEQFSQLFEVTDSPAEAISVLRARVDAWTAGKTPPAWPDAATVTAERSKEIESKLGSLPAAELPGFVAGLNMDERMALANIMEEYDEDTNPPPAAVLELRTVVTSVTGHPVWFPADPELLQKVGIAKGFKVSAESFEKLANHLASEAKQFSKTTVLFFPTPSQLGCVAAAGRIDRTNRIAYQQFPNEEVAELFAEHKGAEAIILLDLQTEKAVWIVRDGKAQALESNAKAMEILKSTAESNSRYFTMQVLSLEDAEKINNQQ